MSKTDIATLADFEVRVTGMLRQIEDHEGREALREAAERLLKGTAFTILQVSGLKRLNDILDELDQAIWIEAPAAT
jgi:hypothetical protein